MAKERVARRDLLGFGALATCGLAASNVVADPPASSPAAATLPDLAAELARLEAEYGGTFHIEAERLDAPGLFELRSESVLPTASACKLFVLCELFRQAEAGLIDLEEPIGWKPEQHRGGDGVLRAMIPGQKLSVHNMAVLMIVLSDNIATTVLVESLGPKNINASLKAWKLLDSDFHDGLPGGPTAAEMKDPVSSPRDFNSLLKRIQRREILTPKSCDEIVRILRAQRVNDMLPRYIPVGEDWGQAATWIANKTGYGRCRVDVGIIRSAALTMSLALFFRPDKPPPHRFKSMSDYPPVLAAARGCKAVYDHFAK